MRAFNCSRNAWRVSNKQSLANLVAAMLVRLGSGLGVPVDGRIGQRSVTQPRFQHGMGWAAWSFGL